MRRRALLGSASYPFAALWRPLAEGAIVLLNRWSITPRGNRHTGRSARGLQKPPRKSTLALIVALVLCLGATLVSPGASAQLSQNTQALDGRGNNQNNPDWGRAGTPYTRFAPARYVDGKSQPFGGPNSRFVSNRIINDEAQNIFSENNESQWGNVWGQFLDHTFGLRDENGTVANIPFNQADPMESFTNTLGFIPFTRSAAAPGTGVTNTRQQTNTVSSYIDAWPVYGGTDQRLDFLREGSQDGNPNNNGARLFLPNNYLPRRDAAATPPALRRWPSTAACWARRTPLAWPVTSGPTRTSP